MRANVQEYRFKNGCLVDVVSANQQIHSFWVWQRQLTESAKAINSNALQQIAPLVESSE